MVSIPKQVAHNENIIRGIYSPINVNSKGKLQPNAFKSPYGVDEVSVLRLDFTTESFCKNHCKSIENTEGSIPKIYHGLAIIKALSIVQAKAEIRHTPLEGIPMHADIIVGHICQRGESLPAEINYKLKEMVKAARYVPDPNPKDLDWQGGDLKKIWDS